MDDIYVKVNNAKSILVAGGGIVGCEVAGELAVAFGKDKKIGICYRGENLLPSLPERFGQVTE
jgi:apoptosis-inducing factor 2